MLSTWSTATDGAPQERGAIYTAGADGRLTGVTIAAAFEDAAAEGVHHVADDDGFGGTGKGSRRLCRGPL